MPNTLVFQKLCLLSTFNLRTFSWPPWQNTFSCQPLLPWLTSMATAFLPASDKLSPQGLSGSSATSDLQMKQLSRTWGLPPGSDTLLKSQELTPCKVNLHEGRQGWREAGVELGSLSILPDDGQFPGHRLSWSLSVDSSTLQWRNIAKSPALL